MDVIYLDFQKAFDTDKEREPHGIKESFLTWIDNFISGRKQQEVFNGILSTCA